MALTEKNGHHIWMCSQCLIITVSQPHKLSIKCHCIHKKTNKQKTVFVMFHNYDIVNMIWSARGGLKQLLLYVKTTSPSSCRPHNYVFFLGGAAFSHGQCVLCSQGGHKVNTAWTYEEKTTVTVEFPKGCFFFPLLNKLLTKQQTKWPDRVLKQWRVTEISNCNCIVISNLSCNALY